jgi:hypothetical protein
LTKPPSLTALDTAFRSTQGGWVRYEDHTDQVKLPPWLSDPTQLCHSSLGWRAAEYTRYCGSRPQNVGLWIDQRAAQQAGAARQPPAKSFSARLKKREAAGVPGISLALKNRGRVNIAAGIALTARHGYRNDLFPDEDVPSRCARGSFLELDWEALRMTSSPEGNRLSGVRGQIDAGLRKDGMNSKRGVFFYHQSVNCQS